MPNSLDRLLIDSAPLSGRSEDEQPDSENRPIDRDDEGRRQGVKDQKAERQLRKLYAGRAFWFAVAGVAFWGLMLVWTGCATYYTSKPPFSDNVLIAITTATSINLFAAFLGVIRGLFPANGKRSKAE